MCINIYRDADERFFSMPRFLWVHKDWTLKELHHYCFDHFKELFRRWYKDISDTESKADKNNILEAIKAKTKPNFKHPDTLAELNYEALEALYKEDLEKQFKAFFPKLSEENWKEELDKKKFSLDAMPY